MLRHSSALARGTVPIRGFTLIEVLIVTAIVGILAAVALPSYQRYVMKSRAKAATADLVTLSLMVESRFQRTLAYPTGGTADTAATMTAFTGWDASQKVFFKYTYGFAAGDYTLTATGLGTTACTLTLTGSGVRNATGANCGFSGAW